jgi:hypothetical protein
MANPKQREGSAKERSPGIDPQGDRPMSKNGDKQPERSDWREQTQMVSEQLPNPQPQQGQPRHKPYDQQPQQQAEADPRQQRDRKQRGEDATGGQTGDAHEAQRKSAYR